jgi:hypothetical protein
MPWRQLLLESHMIAVISATGVGLLAFPGADLAKSAQPALVRMVMAAEPVTEPVAQPSKGPVARLTGAPEARAEAPRPVSAPVLRETAPARERANAPAPKERAFEGCLQAHEHAACRRAFEAVIERQGGFALAPSGYRLGAQPLADEPRLDFEEGPQWLRTLESVSEDGIRFKRVRRGTDHELSFGISPDGVLGFTLEERRGSDR